MSASPLRNSLDTLLTALAPVIWGSTYIVTTQFLPPDRPLTAAVIRCLPAGLILLAFSRTLPERAYWPKLFLLSLLNIGAFQALLFIAAYRLPGGLAAVIGAVQPLVVMSLAWAIDARRPGLLGVLAALAAIGGMGLLLLSPDTGWDLIGVGAGAIGALCMAAGTFLSRRWGSGLPLTAFTGWQLLLGGAMLVPLALVSEPALPPLSAGNIGGYIYLCLGGALLAYALWFRGLSKISPVAVSALGLLSPLSAVVLGWVFLGEQLGLQGLFGFSIVLLGVMAVQLSQTAPLNKPENSHV